MKNKTEIKKAFKNTNMSLNFGDDYLNISRPDGVHCEFYGDSDFNYLTATYTVNGKVKDLDFWFPNDVEEFVKVVSKVLEV